LPPTHVLAEHASVWVQASPSLHGEPSGLLEVVHALVTGLQVPATSHWPTAAQTDTSFGGLEQKPVVGSQVPAR
jgi:hypothetical protein